MLRGQEEGKGEDGSLSSAHALSATAGAADPAAPLPQSHGYWISVLGRFVFGFSYESLITANQGLLSDWFGVRPTPPLPCPPFLTCCPCQRRSRYVSLLLVCVSSTALFLSLKRGWLLWAGRG